MIEKIMELLEQTDASVLDKLDIQTYLEQLDSESLFLEALQQMGVENWENYQDAIDLYQEWLEEEEEDNE